MNIVASITETYMLGLVVLAICILTIVSILITNKIEERQRKIIAAKIRELKRRKAELETEIVELKNSTEDNMVLKIMGYNDESCN